VEVQTHHVRCIDPFCQWVEEDEELEFFEEWLLFTDFAASLAKSVPVEYADNGYYLPCD
jgi:hypothetical protein